MRVPSPCPPPTTRSLPPPQFLLPRSQISSASRGGGHSLLRCPDFGRRPSRGCRWGGSSCSGLPSRGPVQGAGAGRRRSWVLSLAPGGGGRSVHPTQPRVGARAPDGLWAGRGSAQTSPQVVAPDPRSTTGAPALRAPAPAAQLLTMTSSHLPQSARTSPRVWGPGAGWVGGVLRQEVPARGSWEL